MALNSSPMKIPIAGAILLGGLVGFDLATIEIMDTAIGTEAIFILPLALALAYMFSARSMGEMSNAELAAFSVPTLVVIGMAFSNWFVDFVESFQPYFGAAMLIVAMIAYWALTNENV